jgi:hypothetical protein
VFIEATSRLDQVNEYFNMTIKANFLKIKSQHLYRVLLRKRKLIREVVARLKSLKIIRELTSEVASLVIIII